MSTASSPSPSKRNRWKPTPLDMGAVWPKRRDTFAPDAFRAALAASARREPQSPARSKKAAPRPGKRDSGPDLAAALPGVLAAVGELLELVGRPELFSADKPLARGRTLIELHESEGGRTLYLHYGCRPEQDRDLVERAGKLLEQLLNMAGVRTTMRSVQNSAVFRGVTPKGLAVALRLAGPGRGAGL